MKPLSSPSRITRRSLLASSPIAFAAACARNKGTGYPGYALIAASGERALAVVDLTRFRLWRDIPLGAEPTEVLASSTGHIYVLTPRTGSLHQLTPDLRRKAVYRWADTLETASLSADGKWLVATSAESKQVLVAGTHAPASVQRYNFGSEPRYLAAGATGYAAVSTGATGSIELLHLASGKRWRRKLSGEAGKLVFRSDGQVLLAANLQDRSLTVLSVPDLEVIADLPLAMQPSDLCFSRDGGQLFITGEGMDGIAIVFPFHTLQVDQTVLAGRDPGVMAVSDSPPYLFVGSASGSDLCIMDVNHRRVIGLVDIASQPGFIAVTPDNQYALILSEKSGDMAVIRIPAIRQNFLASSHKASASLFTMLPVGDRPVHAVVVPGLA